MEILGRFDGHNGQITVAQERKTGARLYVEEGVKQSYVLPGGSAGLDYVRLMARVLEGALDIILFGCGGGALASELHNRGCRVTVVDDNPISFEIARRYFWMPSSIHCVADGMAEFLARSGQAKNSTLWLVAQAVSEILTDGEKEKQLMQGLLNQREKLEQEQGTLF